MAELTSNLRYSASILLLSSWRSAMGGMSPLSNTRMALITPAIPAAPSRCPIFALRAPLDFISDHMTTSEA
jgi:hypothetical protein